MRDGAPSRAWDEGDSPVQCKAVIGLGNPGSRYSGTRHNAGFLAVDALLAALQPQAGLFEPFRPFRQFEADMARADNLRLIKPATYMNLSGRAVSAVTRFFRIEPSEILVVHDDIDLPLGRLRFRRGGSSGGHNGIASILQHLGTGDFLRLKMGIGRRADLDRIEGEVIGHVLGSFGPGEQEEAGRLVNRAVEAILCLLEEGLERAMTRYNAAGDSKGGAEG